MKKSLLLMVVMASFSLAVNASGGAAPQYYTDISTGKGVWASMYIYENGSHVTVKIENGILGEVTREYKKISLEELRMQKARVIMDCTPDAGGILWAGELIDSGLGDGSKQLDNGICIAKDKTGNLTMLELTKGRYYPHNIFTSN